MREFTAKVYVLLYFLVLAIFMFLPMIVIAGAVYASEWLSKPLKQEETDKKKAPIPFEWTCHVCGRNSEEKAKWSCACKSV